MVSGRELEEKKGGRKPDERNLAPFLFTLEGEAANATGAQKKVQSEGGSVAFPFRNEPGDF